MTSLALFPQLRRTLTDVMEDELYHVPSITNASQQQQLPQQQGQQFQPPQPPQQQQQQSIMSNFHFNNSNNSLSNYKASPTLSHAKLYRNPSALNSEEMLTIPDSNNHHHHHHNNYSYQSQNQELSRIPSHDMYYDIPEPLPLDEDRHIFNEFADPNLTTTNHIYRSEQQYAAHHNQPQQNNELNPHHPHHAPAKLLKFNDDLSLDYFTNEDDSKFVIYPVMSPTMIPEEIEDEELSEDDDDDNAYDNELTYLDNTIEDVKNPLNYPHQQFQAQQEESHRNEEQLIKKQEFEEQQKQQQLQQQQPQQDQSAPIIKKENDEDVTQDLESDIDRMSLDSSDDEYSSNSSVIEEDSYTPSFKTQLQTPPKELKPKQKRSSSTSIPSTSPQTTTINNNNNFNNNHQCQLINPSTNQPCLKQFSRPYDLIRHQETIHASRKKIFRCVVCNKLEGGLSNKTFSRGDALSRHIRVKHGLTGTEATDALQYAKDHVEYV